MLRELFFNSLSIYFYRFLNMVGFKQYGIKLKFYILSSLYIYNDDKIVILKFSVNKNFKRFIWVLKFLFSNLKSGFYFKLRMLGLGFRVKRWRTVRKLRSYKLLLGFSSFIFIFKAKNFIIKRKDKYNILLYTPFRRELNDMLVDFLFLRLIRPYKKKRGVLDYRQLFIMRPGKVR